MHGFGEEVIAGDGLGLGKLKRPILLLTTPAQAEVTTCPGSANQLSFPKTGRAVTGDHLLPRRCAHRAVQGWASCYLILAAGLVLALS